MGLSIWQIAVVVILVVLLFGRGKISSLMGDVAKGIKSFKKGMSTDTTEDNQLSDATEDNQPKDATEDNQPKDVSEENKDSKDSN